MQMFISRERIAEAFSKTRDDCLTRIRRRCLLRIVDSIFITVTWKASSTLEREKRGNCFFFVLSTGTECLFVPWTISGKNVEENPSSLGVLWLATIDGESFRGGAPLFVRFSPPHPPLTPRGVLVKITMLHAREERANVGVERMQARRKGKEKGEASSTKLGGKTERPGGGLAPITL